MPYTDDELIIELATSSASLDRSPKKNWVEKAGGLPPYIRKLARAISKRGHSLDRAIAIAISRVKVWAAGGGEVNADTRAKAAKALAAWEALKAKSKVKLTHEDGSEYIALSSITSFDTGIVRSAWESRQNAARRASGNPDTFPYSWIEELGTDYIVVSVDDPSGKSRLRYPYTVDEDHDVTFGEPTKIKQVWVEDDDDDSLTLSERRGLADILFLTAEERESALERIARVAPKKS